MGSPHAGSSSGHGGVHELLLLMLTELELLLDLDELLEHEELEHEDMELELEHELLEQLDDDLAATPRKSSSRTTTPDVSLSPETATSCRSPA